MEVINCRKANLNKIGYNDLEHWLEDPNHVYIGRNMVFYVKGAVASKWANPFSVKKYGRDECLKMYREYILKKPGLLKFLTDLEGKSLACWCAPEGCHGDVLVDLLSEKKKIKITFKKRN